MSNSISHGSRSDHTDVLHFYWGLFSSSLQYDQDGVNQDLEIVQEIHILNIDDIVLQTLHHLLYIFSISEFDHSPGSDARSYFLKMDEMGSGFLDALNIVGAFGLGPTKDISPAITLKIWGISSKRYLRIRRPQAVMRLSFSEES